MAVFWMSQYSDDYSVYVGVPNKNIKKRKDNGFSGVQFNHLPFSEWIVLLYFYHISKKKYTCRFC